MKPSEQEGLWPIQGSQGPCLYYFMRVVETVNANSCFQNKGRRHDLWGWLLPTNLVCPPSSLDLALYAVQTFKLFVWAQLGVVQLVHLCADPSILFQERLSDGLFIKAHIRITRNNPRDRCARSSTDPKALAHLEAGLPGSYWFKSAFSLVPMHPEQHSRVDEHIV